MRIRARRPSSQLEAWPRHPRREAPSLGLAAEITPAAARQLVASLAPIYWNAGRFSRAPGERIGVLFGHAVEACGPAGGGVVLVTRSEWVEPTESSPTHAAGRFPDILDTRSRIAREEPALRLVGWWHTHPGFGVFLSDADRRTHRELFFKSHHLALVIDPKDWTAAWFAGRGPSRIEPVGSPFDLRHGARLGGRLA